MKLTIYLKYNKTCFNSYVYLFFVVILKTIWGDM